jgi:predicted RNase H-like HicB family nuclease
MQYPIVIHKDSGSDYGVTFPDIPGCFSAGSTIEEAINMAQADLDF